MDWLTRRVCRCSQPHGEPGSKCRTCEGRVERSSGSDHHSTQVRRTYTEEGDPCHGVTFEGNHTTAVAGPGGYYKRMTSQGREWSGTVAVGGTSSGSWAHAGPNGIDGYAGEGGHALSMYGSGSNFTAAIYGPGGQVSTRKWDGSTSRRRGNYDTSERISYPEKQPGRIIYGNGDGGAARYGDERQGGIMYSGKKKKQKAIGW